jgi:TRAP-type C4-dicarboxylate transport system permease large subunit
MATAFLGFGAMFLLALMRVPIAFAMGIVGFVGLGFVLNFHAAMSSATLVIYETGFSYTLSVIPLFILMGNLVTRARMSDELYGAANAFIGHWRGGLAMSTILAGGGFSAICGSSLATTATMAKVAMPSMRRFGYSDTLASGSIAAGGTLGILIPPSIVMIIYGIMTETSVGALFAAGIVPGAIAILLYFAAVQVTTRLKPEDAPPGTRLSWRERHATVKGVGTFAVVVAALALVAGFSVVSPEIAGVIGIVATILFALVFRGVMTVVALFALVMGGIYGGVFTPTEAAAIGAGIALFFAAVRRALTWKLLVEVLADTIRMTTMLFFILIGALLFANFINFTSMPAELEELVLGLNVSPLAVYAVIALIYIGLGCVLESMSMIVLTVPVFFPLVQALGADPIWFGIVVVVVTEISLITPPVGMNIFVLNTVLPDVQLGTIFKGIVPFVAVDIVRLALLILVPVLSLFLPRALGY